MSVPSKPKASETDASYCVFGTNILSKLLQSLQAQIQGVIESEEIEYVHKMRVASRRIRATMPLFQICFPKKKFKKWLTQVKKVTRLLGDARDLDVQIAFMQNYLEKLESTTDKPSLALLLKSYRDRRKTAQTIVESGLKELQNSVALKEMRELFEETDKELDKEPFHASSVREKAYWHIASRIDDFLELEKFVHQKNALLKHHEMRVKAKHLRYTMEAFSSLYKNDLANEVAVVKEFQDALGEMHDSDVWIDNLKRYMTESEAKGKQRRKSKSPPIEDKQALLNFLNYLKDKKKDHYSHFTKIWAEKQQTNFFGKLRKTVETSLALERNADNQVILPNASAHPKIAVLADIHANLHALDTVIQDAQSRGADAFLNAGDTVGFGAFPNETLQFLHSKKVISILGNFDCEVVKADLKNKGAKKTAVEFTRWELAKSCESYLLSFPKEISLQVADMKLLMVHGSPESMDEHIYNNTPLTRFKELSEKAKADLIIVGHSHEQFHRQVNGVSFLNPGSVGRPGDGNPQAAYAMLSFNPFEVELIRLDYDVEAAAHALRKKMLPESFSQMLLRGVAIETILKEDQAKRNNMTRNCKEITKATQKASIEFNQDMAHANQVRKLALNFFDALKSQHQLGKRERCWLECTSILHDIGISQGLKGHHKNSMKLILNDTRLPFTSEERRIVASVARYHRRGNPKQGHYNLATLDRATIRKIALLASLLRVADALDYSHQSMVKALSVKDSAKKVIVQYSATSSLPLEEMAFNKKKDLFTKVFEKKLVLSWKQQ